MESRQGGFSALVWDGELENPVVVTPWTHGDAEGDASVVRILHLFRDLGGALMGDLPG